MTLLISLFAAIISTICWYTNSNRETLKLSFLALMFWGATIMWMCDAVAEYIELRAAYFEPNVSDMINDTFLGLSVVGLGLFIWIVYLLIKDPKGVLRNSLIKQK